MKSSSETNSNSFEQGTDWDRQAEYLNALKRFRKMYEKYHGFKPPNGATAIWSLGFEMGYDGAVNVQREK